MIVFVRYNQGPAVPVELQEEASVAELQEVVGSQQGVRPEQLRVLFAGRELRSTSTLQGCDLTEQSTVHIILPPSSSSSSPLLLLQERLARRGREEEAQNSLSSSRLPSTSSGLAVILEGSDGGAGGGGGAEAAGLRSRSTFFVYCKTCRSIQPGKLRVRCRSCRETTLTLSRGPSCWDDVLLHARVHGVCQSDGCHGNEAEFYMKCASHPTSDDDLSVGLDLIMTNSREVPCIACTDVMGVVLVFQCSEHHVICLDCFRGYCQTRLDERQFVYHPETGYSLPCAANCEDSLIKELHHFRILGEDQEFLVDEEASLRGRWNRASMLLLQETTKPCPRCSVPVERNGGCMHMQCPLCGAEWCWLCRVGWNGECMGSHWFG
ncbi:E3 ubiquitin-protein ligase parkin isoform X3 [Brachionichthys hirsutus]|uniref:E3 ubiquitin-protein ligase parkin isoform X3 n=1 Tax=Brachionichthys hirsutus TaxID=412623 RepID=UPI003604B3EE